MDLLPPLTLMTLRLMRIWMPESCTGWGPSFLLPVRCDVIKSHMLLAMCEWQALDMAGWPNGCHRGKEECQECIPKIHEDQMPEQP